MIRGPAGAPAPLPDELLAALIADAGGQLGALPLVAFVLAELWVAGGSQPVSPSSATRASAASRVPSAGGPRHWNSTIRRRSAASVSAPGPDQRRWHCHPQARWLEPMQPRMPISWS